MTLLAADPAHIPYVPRQRDRRQALADFLAALSRALDRQNGALLRESFEQMLRRLVPVRTIQLRDTPTRWSGRSGSEPVAFDVPGPEQTLAGVLEATADPRCPLGDWDLQMLSVASHIGALILEIERNRTQLARAGLLGLPRPRREEAASLIGSTPTMTALRSAISRVVATDFTVLLEGESGVGKELVARQIHDQSRRRQGPFVAINCAALVETLLEAELFGIEDRTATGVRGRRGKFEHAEGGTLFLDEISDLSIAAQAKLLRVLQDLVVERVGGAGSHRVDVRIVAATNRSLAELAERGLFRNDLYYRLSGVDIRVPTLRERRDDILALAQHFLDRYRARSLKLSPGAVEVLLHHRWPGNVRELQRVMERAVALAETDTIEIHDLPASVRGDQGNAIAPSLKRNETLRACASRYARLVFERSNGNKREACRLLGISYHTLQVYLQYPVFDDPVSAAVKPEVCADATVDS